MQYMDPGGMQVPELEPPAFSQALDTVCSSPYPELKLHDRSPAAARPRTRNPLSQPGPARRPSTVPRRDTARREPPTASGCRPLRMANPIAATLPTRHATQTGTDTRMQCVGKYRQIDASTDAI